MHANLSIEGNPDEHAASMSIARIRRSMIVSSTNREVNQLHDPCTRCHALVIEAWPLC